MATTPLFAGTVPPIRATPLDTEPKRGLSADVIVVGAGIAGLTTAYLLAREGRRVIVVDAGPVGGGMSGRTTAHLSNVLDDRYAELIRLRGETDARLAMESHTAAIGLIEHIVQAEGIACDFSRLDGYLFPAAAEDAEIIDRENEAVERLGMRGVERLKKPPVAGLPGPCLRFPGQGRFHSMKYLAGLARCIARAGGTIFSGGRVVSVEDGELVVVETESGHRIEAGHGVVATNTPINHRLALHTKQAPYRTYVLAAEIPAEAVADALYWDTGDPYHYVRLQPGAGLDTAWLIVGGEDHKTGQGDDGMDRQQRMEDWARGRFPGMGAVRWRWSGQVMEPVDYLGFAGRAPGERNLYVATGDSGMGMTHGTIAGRIISDLIQGRDNAWAGLYDPARKTLSAAREFARENLNVAGQYLEHATGGEVASTDDIPPGQGAVLRRGLSKRAVFRDRDGTLHERSAVCPHLGCVVSWNSFEQGWDCPCHGSLYAADGTVSNGPSSTSLGE